MDIFDLGRSFISNQHRKYELGADQRDYVNKTVTFHDSLGKDGSTCIDHIFRYLELEHLETLKQPFLRVEWTSRDMRNVIPQLDDGCNCVAYLSVPLPNIF